MPETPDELYARAAGDLRVPPLEQWDTWPFEGAVTPKALEPPSPEPILSGAGGVDCPACDKPDADYVWTTGRWRIRAFEPGGLPLILLLEPRMHVAGPADLPEDLAAEQGVLLGRIERAIVSIGGIGKVHIGRWGEGAEHLHWWFIARPEGFGQLRSSFAELWSDVLPPTPEAVWQDNVERVVAALM